MTSAGKRQANLACRRPSMPAWKHGIMAFAGSKAWACSTRYLHYQAGAMQRQTERSGELP